MKNKMFKLGQQVGEKFDLQKEEIFLFNIEKMSINDKIFYINEVLRKVGLGFPASLLINDKNKEIIVNEFINGFRSVDKEL